MAWRKPKEGLTLLTEGKKEGSLEKMAHIFLAISYSHGVMWCKQYHENVSGKVLLSLSTILSKNCWKKQKYRKEAVLQDGDPQQV